MPGPTVVASASSDAAGPLEEELLMPVKAGHETRIARPPETVFDFFADLRNEPQWNEGHVRDVKMTSAPPIGRGTTFEGSHPGFGTATWTLVEYDRPRHLVIEGFAGEAPYRYVGDFEPVVGGTLFRGQVEWAPRGIWRSLGPCCRCY